MLKIQHFNDPIYTLEALDLLEKKVNNIKLSNSGDHIDQKVADMIYDDLSSILKGAQIKDPSLYHYFKNTEASIASCLLNSFIAIEKIEQDTFKNDLLEKLAGFNDMHCNGVDIVRRLNIVKGDDKNLLSEILKLDIEDRDKISLIKALEDPKPYVDAIFEDILKIKKELQKTYAKFDDAYFKNYFDEDHTQAILDEVNIKYDGDVYVIPSITNFRSLMITIDDEDQSPLQIKPGLTTALSANDNFSFFKDDIEQRLAAFIKIINDPSKLKMIELLKGKKMYGAELAKHLDLKTSTISYHIDSLINAGLIKAKRIDNRIYYEYDKEHALSIIEHLKKKFS